MKAWIRSYLPLAIRIARGIQYIALTGAGISLMTTPTQMLQTTLGQVVYGWAAFLVLGGVLCTIGTATKIWAGEFTGLTLLITANWIWGGTLIGIGGNASKYGVVFAAWGFGLLAREFQILEKVRGAAGAEKQRRRARRRRDG